MKGPVRETSKEKKYEGQTGRTKERTANFFAQSIMGDDDEGVTERSEVESHAKLKDWERYRRVPANSGKY